MRYDTSPQPDGLAFRPSRRQIDPETPGNLFRQHCEFVADRGFVRRIAKSRGAEISHVVVKFFSTLGQPIGHVRYCHDLYPELVPTKFERPSSLIPITTHFG